MNTKAPSSANRLAAASPMPALPPVTTATLPSNFPVMTFSVGSGGDIAACIQGTKCCYLFRGQAETVSLGSVKHLHARPDLGEPRAMALQGGEQARQPESERDR